MESNQSNRKKLDQYRDKITSLLSRVQVRRNRINQPSSTTINNHNYKYSFPPEEASASLGREIALTYVLALSSSASNLLFSSDDHETDQSNAATISRHHRQKKEWHGIGEQIIDTLCNSTANYNNASGGTSSSDKQIYVNLAVVQSFFSSLAKESLETLNSYELTFTPSASSSCNIMTWWVGFVLQCEECVVSDERGGGGISNSGSNSVDALVFAIRSFAAFSHGYYNCMRISRKGEERETSSEVDKNVGKMDEWNQVAELYQRCTQPYTRQLIIRECILVAFDHLRQHLTKNISDSAASTRAATDAHCGNASINELYQLVKYLSPLASIAVASAPLPTQSEQTKLFLSEVLRECRLISSTMSMQHKQASSSSFSDVNSLSILKLVPWLIHLLDIFLVSSVAQSEADHVRSAMVIGYDYLLSLTDFIASCCCEFQNNSHNRNNQIEENVDILGTFCNIVFDRILPLYVTTSLPCGTGSALLCQRLPLRPILSQICVILTCCDSSAKKLKLIKKIDVSSKALYSLAIMAHVMSDEVEVKIILDIILQIVQLQQQRIKENCNDSSKLGSMMWGVIHCLGCIFSNTASCMDVAGQLMSCSVEALRNNDLKIQEQTAIGEQTEDEIRSPVKNQRCSQFLELFDNTHDKKERLKLLELITLIESSNVKDGSMEPTFSASEQCGALLIGLSLLRTTAHEGDDDFLVGIFTYLNGLLRAYPHLGIRSLPCIMVYITDSITNNMTKQVLKAFEFLCSTVACEASCAHEVWSFLSATTATPHIPINVQSMTVRLYPVLCQANKRLYSRIRDSIGNYVVHPNPQLRVVASTTICDLAKDDLIADVEDFIGWIQNLLLDEEDLAVYFAILSLHHLVLGGDLDYGIVLKVLGKKLVKINDIESVLNLGGIVIEALVILLGDGNIEFESESGSESEEELLTHVSPQIQSSVSSLVELALSKPLSFGKDHEDDQKFSPSSKASILCCICKSLSKYSFVNLGLDEEEVRALSHSSQRELSPPFSNNIKNMNQYDKLKMVAYVSLNHYSEGFICEKLIESARNFAMKIIRFEEQSLGPTLWKKGSKPSNSLTSTKVTNVVSKSCLAELPSYKNVNQRYHQEPSISTGSASLACFLGANISDVGEAMTELGSIASDMLDQPADPVFRSFYLHSWILGMKKIWALIEKLEDESKGPILKEVIDQIIAWEDDLDEIDVVYIAIASLTLVIPDASVLSQQIDFAQNLVMTAYENRLFENNGAACSTIGLVALRNINCSSLSQIDVIIDALNKELVESTKNGNICFEAAFSLGLISQALASTLIDTKRNDSATQMRRILATLVEEMASCFKRQNSIVLNLACCLNSGKPTPDLVQSCASLQTRDLEMIESSKHTMTCLSIALAKAMPCMLHMNMDFLRGLYALLFKMPWGYGKGYMLASTHKVCEIAGILKREDHENLINSSISALEEASVGLENNDGLFVLAQVCNQGERNMVYAWFKRILQSNSDNFRLEVRVSAISAACEIVGSCPSLSGDDNGFLNCPQLKKDTQKSQLCELVDILSSLTENFQEDAKIRGRAAIMFGHLSSMKYASHQKISYIESTAEQATSVRLSLPKSIDNLSKFTNLIPFAIEGSLVSMLHRRFVEALKKSVHTETKDLITTLSCLKVIALPGQFAKLLETLLKVAGNDTNMLKATCIEVLTAQAGSLRHAASDRRDFVRVTVLLAKQAPQAFFSLLGPASDVFMASLDRIIPQWTTKITDEAITVLWSICCYEVTQERSAKCMISFLSSLHNIFMLEPAASRMETIAPGTLSGLHRNLVKDFLPFLGSILPHGSTDDILKIEDVSSIWKEYSSCLKFVSIQKLDDYNFFSFQNEHGEIFDSSNIARACSISFFEQEDILGSRIYDEIAKAQLWISRQKPISDHGIEYGKMHVYWYLALNLAFSGRKSPSECMKMLLIALFENMLVGQKDSLSIEIMCTQAATWWKPIHFSASPISIIRRRNIIYNLPSSLSMVLLDLLLVDLPFQIGSIAHKISISGFVKNRAQRIISGSSSYALDIQRPIVKRDIISSLGLLVLSCNNHKETNSVQSSFTASMLLGSSKLMR